MFQSESEHGKNGQTDSKLSSLARGTFATLGFLSVPAVLCALPLLGEVKRSGSKNIVEAVRKVIKDNHDNQSRSRKPINIRYK